jgi:hypothetical protein
MRISTPRFIWTSPRLANFHDKNVRFIIYRVDYRDIRIDIRINNPKGTLHLDVSIISLTKEQAKKDPYDTLTTEEQMKKNKYRVLG